jgi:hypothetical protein
VDADNHVDTRLYSNGDFRLYETVAGVATQKIAAGAASVSDDDDLQVILDGEDGEIFVNGASLGTTSAINSVLEGGNGFIHDIGGGSDGAMAALEIWKLYEDIVYIK